MFRMRQLIMVMMNNVLTAQSTNDDEGDGFWIHTRIYQNTGKGPKPNDAARSKAG
jgi:hypothetical protein